jgi:hypothetical protein
MVGGAAVLALGMTVGTGMASGAATRPRNTAGLHTRLSGLSTVSGRLSAALSTTYGAGYFSYPGQSNGVSTVSTSFKMPTFHCHSTTDNEWLLPGIWVYDGGGTLTEQVDVNFNCNAGSLYQGDVICISGAACDQSLAVAPRDTIRASLAYTPTATIGTIKDVTSGQSVQVVGPAITTDYTVFIGDAGPSQFGFATLVPTFSTLKFSNNQVNSQDLSDWGPAKYNLKTGSVVQITTGGISAAEAFVTTWVHN